jgi:DNA (cytosine-5)-methyltransferase 3A
MDGDGHIRKSKTPKVNIYKRNTTVSEKLALTLSLAIQKCYNGVSICHTPRKNKKIIENRIVNQKDTYEVTYTENKTTYSKYKQINNYTVYNLTKTKSFIEGDIKNVYNIEVEEDNSYVLNNLIVHNCQGFSFSGKQLNFNDPRSKLVFDYVRILNEIKPKYWLLENVVMKKEYENIITDCLGVEPVKINSSLVSAQNRVRLYWANFEITQPSDKGINLIDILETDDLINPSAIRGRRLNKATILGRRLNERGVRDDYNKDVPITQCLEVRATNTNKSNCLTTVEKDNVLTNMPIGRHKDAFKNKLPFRYYTLKEYCRLQTVPENYFDNIVSDSQAKKMLGNGWTVDVIAHILSSILK